MSCPKTVQNVLAPGARPQTELPSPAHLLGTILFPGSLVHRLSAPPPAVFKTFLCPFLLALLINHTRTDVALPVLSTGRSVTRVNSLLVTRD